MRRATRTPRISPARALLHRHRRRRPDRSGARGGEERRRVDQRRRPAKALRLHHALDRRSQPARDRRLDWRRFADSRAHAEGAARDPDPRRLWAARPADERLSCARCGGDPVADMRRRFWEAALEGPIAEAALAGNESAAKAISRDELERWGGASPFAAGRSLSRRRRPWRSGPHHLPRVPADAEGGRRAVRPADRRGA